jgi:hypothetical protein
MVPWETLLSTYVDLKFDKRSALERLEKVSAECFDFVKLESESVHHLFQTYFCANKKNKLFLYK